MEEYSIHEQATLFNMYCHLNSSLLDTQRLFCKHFNKTTLPSEELINDLITRYNEDGTIFSKRTKIAQKPIVNPNPIIINDNDSNESKLELNDYNNFPYKIRIYGKLLPADRLERVKFALDIQEIASKNENFIHKLIMSNEMNFDLNGNVDTLFYRICGRNIENYFKINANDMKYLTVWCGITSERIIGPYFYENKFGETASVTSERYNIMIRNVLENTLDFKRDLWFQQDNKSAHISELNLTRLKKIFPNRLICQNGDINCPTRSPDLTAIDFFLWGYLKERVYTNNPKTLYELKMNIVNEIACLSSNILTDVMKSVLYRASLCELSNGGYMQDIFIPSL